MSKNKKLTESESKRVGFDVSVRFNTEKQYGVKHVDEGLIETFIQQFLNDEVFSDLMVSDIDVMVHNVRQQPGMRQVYFDASVGFGVPDWVEIPSEERIKSTIEQFFDDKLFSEWGVYGTQVMKVKNVQTLGESFKNRGNTTMTENTDMNTLEAFEDVFALVVENRKEEAEELLRDVYKASAQKIYREIVEGEIATVDSTKEGESSEPVAENKRSCRELINEMAMGHADWHTMSKKDRDDLRMAIAEKYNLIPLIKEEMAAEKKAKEDAALAESSKSEKTQRAKKLVESYTAEIDGFDAFTPEQKKAERIKIAKELGVYEDLTTKVKTSDENVENIQDEVEKEKALESTINEDSDEEVDNDEFVEVVDDNESSEEGADEGVSGEEVASDLNPEGDGEEENKEDLFADFDDEDAAVEGDGDLQDQLEKIEDGQEEIKQALDDMAAEFDKIFGDELAAVETEEEVAVEPEVADEEATDNVLPDGGEEVADEDEMKNESATAKSIREYLEKVKAPNYDTKATSTESPYPSKKFTDTGKLDRKKPEIGKKANEKPTNVAKPKDMGGTTKPNVTKVKTPAKPKKTEDGKKSVIDRSA